MSFVTTTVSQSLNVSPTLDFLAVFVVITLFRENTIDISIHCFLSSPHEPKTFFIKEVLRKTAFIVKMALTVLVCRKYFM